VHFVGLYSIITIIYKKVDHRSCNTVLYDDDDDDMLKTLKLYE